ncbi:MAG: DUF5979 domain-containing protein [Microbacterium enclense]
MTLAHPSRIGHRSRIRRLATPLAIAAVVLASLAAAPAASAAPAVSFAMTATTVAPPPTPVTSVPTGSQISYQLSLQCSGTEPCRDVVIDLSGDRVASGIETYASWTPPTGVAATIATTSTGVRITFPNVVPAGFSQTFPVVFNTQNWSTPNGTVATMVGTMTGSNFPAPAPVTSAVTLTATNMAYTLDKHTVTGADASAGGTDFAYDIWLKAVSETSCSGGGATPSGMSRLQQFTLSDPLPAGAEFVSASAYAAQLPSPLTPTYDAGTRTVSVTFTGGVSALCGTYNSGLNPTGMRVTVRWPASALPDGTASTTITNTASASGTYVDGTPLELQSSVTHALRPFESSGHVLFAKYLRFFGANYAYPAPGSPQFVLDYGNASSSTLNTSRAVITDPALSRPTQALEFSPVSTSGTLRWTASDGTTGSVSNPGWVTMADILPAGTTLSSFQFEDDLPLGPGERRYVVVYSAPTTNADVGSYDNCASATLSFSGGSDAVSPTSCAPYSVVESVPNVWTGTGLTHNALSGSVVNGQPVYFHAAVQGDGATPLHPQMTICLPPGWTITPGTLVAASTISLGFSVVGTKNRADGYTCTTLVWPSGVQLTSSQQVRVNFTATASGTSPAGDNTFELWGGDSTRTLTDTSMSGGYSWGSVDTQDVDGDSNTTEWLSRGVDSVTVGQITDVNVVKYVAADGSGLSTSPPGSPTIVLPGTSTADYRLVFRNNGNVPTTGLVAYDVLPYSGDTGISESVQGSPRGSTFDVLVTSPVATPAGISVQYSESSNPCRPEVNPSPTGTCDNDWSPSLPAGGARALRFAYTGSDPLAPGTSYTVDFEADTSAGQPGQAACNSVAIDTDQTLATEPSPSCIRVNQLGDLFVKKQLRGAGVKLVDRSTFTFGITCTYRAQTVRQTSITVTGSGDLLTSDPVTGVPIGSLCVVTETDNGGADFTPPPVSVLIMDPDTPTAVNVTNWFTVATVDVAKVAVGDGASLTAVADDTYELQVTCQMEEGGVRTTLHSSLVSVRAGETVTVKDSDGDPVLLPVGARCYAAETDAGYASESKIDFDSYQNGAVVTSHQSDDPQQLHLTATNTFDAATLTISKVVTGTGPGGSFPFRLACTLDGQPYALADDDSAFSLSDGETRAVQVTPGVRCAVTELDPRNATVTYLDDSGATDDGVYDSVEETAAITVTNFFAPPPVDSLPTGDGDETGNGPGTGGVSHSPGGGSLASTGGAVAGSAALAGLLLLLLGGFMIRRRREQS